MSKATGVKKARENTSHSDGDTGCGDTVVRQVETPHVKVTVHDGPAITVEINYWDDDGGDMGVRKTATLMKGSSSEPPVTVMLRKCPSGPC